MRWWRRRQASSGDPNEADGWIDPSLILFSLPTICAELPGASAESVRREGTRLHEDDWRQVELVANVHALAICDNFQAINEIRSERSGLGFVRIHIREEPHDPLRGLNIGLDCVVEALGAEYRVADGLALIPGGRRIADAFAFVGPHSTVYGIERGGIVTTLGVHPTSEVTGRPDSGVDALAQLAEQHDAYLVDWLGSQSYPEIEGS